MELTERYDIVIAFVGRTGVELSYMEQIWSTAINEEFQRTRTYVNAIINERSLACVDCAEQERVFVITATRNPMQTPNPNDYYNSLGNILFEVRRDLDEPYTLVSSATVQVAYFSYTP